MGPPHSTQLVHTTKWGVICGPPDHTDLSAMMKPWANSGSTRRVCRERVAVRPHHVFFSMVDELFPRPPRCHTAVPDDPHSARIGAHKALGGSVGISFSRGVRFRGSRGPRLAAWTGSCLAIYSMACPSTPCGPHSARIRPVVGQRHVCLANAPGGTLRPCRDPGAPRCHM